MPRPATVVPLLGWRPTAAADFAAKGMPLGELWEAVFRLVWNAPHYSPKSSANRRRTWELSRALPPHPTPVDVLAWLTSLRSQFSADTAEHHRKNLAALYRFGSDLGVSSGNPAALVPHQRCEGKPAPIVNIAELWPALLDACADERERAFIGVLRFAGLRRGEALGLHLADVNTYATPWRLEVVRQRPDPNRLDHTRPKTSASARCLPVRGPLAELLAPVLEAGPVEVRTGLGGGGERRVVPYLFPYRGNDLADLIGRLRVVAPLAFPEGHKAWHALRDTLGLEQHRAGKTVSEIASTLGHGSEYTTRVHYLSRFGRDVHAGVFEGLDSPTARGPAPPGGAGPPVAVGAATSGRKRTAAVGAAAVQERSTVQSNQGGQEATCSTPSRRSESFPAATRRRSASAGTPASGTNGRGARSARGSAPAAGSDASATGSRRQRALPGLAAGPVVTPRRRP